MYIMCISSNDIFNKQYYKNKTASKAGAANLFSFNYIFIHFMFLLFVASNIVVQRKKLLQAKTTTTQQINSFAQHFLKHYI